MTPRPRQPGSASVRECPRCGYDLSGAIAAWANECPLEGVCAECGLTFRWPEIYYPLRRVPPWSFEHSETWSARLLASTLIRAALPIRFWKRMRLEFDVRGSRLLWIAATLLFASHFAAALISVVVVIVDHRFGHPLWRWDGFPPSRTETVFASLARLALPYSGAPLGAENEPYGFWDWSWNDCTASTTWLPTVGLTALVTPFAYLTLGQTLRIHRIRRAHLVRAGALSLLALPLTLLAWGVVLAYRGGSARVLYAGWADWSADLANGLLGFGLVWLVVYWWSVSKHYLRLPRASLIALLLVAQSSLLAILLVAAATLGRSLYWWFD